MNKLLFTVRDSKKVIAHFSNKVIAKKFRDSLNNKGEVTWVTNGPDHK